MGDLTQRTILHRFHQLFKEIAVADGHLLQFCQGFFAPAFISLPESLVYEHQKHTGELPIVGVNTFLNKNGSPTVLPNEVIRSTKEEKEQQIQNLHAFWKRNEGKTEEALRRLKQAAVNNENLFAELMETVKHCSLGQITHALYEVGGQYRRNM